ncbi:MAG: hypothetical protein QOF11_1510 [Chloroflexota bacterium]|nr:hypothetical protein [Chloroflexota bacterium]
MGARTDAARAEVVAARQALATETTRMGTATREAVDVPARVRRAPAKAAAVAGGTAFVVLGGPRRIARRLKRAVRGEPVALPSSMLPEEIDKAIRSLGKDGEKVRGAIERSFAGYLAKNGKLTDRSVRGATEEALATAIRVAGRGVGVQLVKRALAGEKSELGNAFDQMRRIVQRGTTGADLGYDVDEAFEDTKSAGNPGATTKPGPKGS